MMQGSEWLKVASVWAPIVGVVAVAGGFFAMSGNRAHDPAAAGREDAVLDSDKFERATFGAGCFWCTEAVFQQLNGVQSVVSGYSGGHVPSPTYREICGGATGHAEVTQIAFDPNVISYAELLEVFWQTHDPTTPDRQGNDVGPQYRSAIFYHDDEQRRLAEHYKQKLDESGAFDAPIVTEIARFTEFYRAESYHQNYFDENPYQPYCAMVVRPKVDKVKKVFKDKLKGAAAK
jgi:peptide-methionine (S)-S-oxide reductase